MAWGGPEIETIRLRLRPLTVGDLDAIHRIWTDPAVRRCLWDGEEISRERAGSVLRRSAEGLGSGSFGLWAMVHKERGGLIGFCGFWPFDDAPELAYGLLPPYWGMGLATEAARAMIQHGFEVLGFERIVASADTENAASLRVMEKAGMGYEKRETQGEDDRTYYTVRR